jgi:uncharacterized membrane protein
LLWLLIVLQWLHVLGGIIWFGASMLTDFVLFPMLRSLSPSTRSEWLRAFTARYGGAIGAIGGLTVLLGIGRGIAGGVFSVIGQPYGLTWIAAIVVSVGVGTVGGGLIGRTAQEMAKAADEATMNPLYARIQRYTPLEVGGFFVIFTLMIAMRFGY